MTSPIRTRSFWVTAAQRATRNAVQVLIPFLALAGLGQIDGAGVLAVVAAAGLAAVASILKTAAGVVADPTDPLGWQLGERVLGAAAGALAAVLPLDLAGAIALDWRGVALSVAGAAGMSLATWYLGGGNPDALDGEHVA